MTKPNDDQAIRPWRVLKTRLAFKNKWARIRHDECELPGGQVVEDYYYWEGGDFSQVFALTPANEIVLTRQYKHGVKEIVLELPVGLIGSDESAILAAKRELREETGYTAKDWISLGVLNVSSAKATTRANVFLATNAQPTGTATPDSTEQIEVLLVSVDELLHLISQGLIKDVNSVATTLLALRFLEGNHTP